MCEGTSETSEIVDIETPPSVEIIEEAPPIINIIENSGSVEAVGTQGLPSLPPIPSVCLQQDREGYNAVHPVGPALSKLLPLINDGVLSESKVSVIPGFVHYA